MTDKLDFYESYLLAIGRLCAGWAVMDRELTALLAAMLGIDKAQAACLATEMPDVSSRCRMVKTLCHTIDAPQTWREDLVELVHVISHLLAPERNRFIHDHFGVSEDKLLKVDGRVKLAKPKSFSELQLTFDREEIVNKDHVELVAVRAIVASARVATARFDVEFHSREGHFPETPSLERRRVKQIIELEF